MQLQPSKEGLLLNVSLQFQLAEALQEVLRKGVPLHFVAQADVYSPRWYWRDKEIQRNQRRVRLSYSPLSRRWQLSPSGVEGRNEVNLRMTYASLDEAMVALRHINAWPVAPAQSLEPGQDYSVQLHFYLDLAQLPRPFQIGLEGQSEWKLDAKTERQGQWPTELRGG